MARQVAASIENNFTRGLITETTELSFPENACTDLDNCDLTDTGKITRRLPFDVEADAVYTTTAKEDGEVIVSFRWESVAGSGTTNYLVMQKGSNLLFFDVSDPTAAISNTKIDFEVDLDEHIATDTIHDPADYPCQFAVGNGNLLVVNKACDPFYVEYSLTNDSFSVETIMIKIRDFKGLDDKLSVTERPTATVAELRTNNPEHYYNLGNQGWFVNSLAHLTAWDTARSDVPSNADYYQLYLNDTNTIDNTNAIPKLSPGNRPAPKGHFILDAFNPDRDAAQVADGGTSVTFRSLYPEAIANQSALTTASFSMSSGTLSAAFDGNWSKAASACAQSSSETLTIAVVKTLAAPTIISQVRWNGPNNGPFGTGYVEVPPTITWQLYGKTGTAPASSTDGTLLGSQTMSPSWSGGTRHNAIRTITSTDQTTAYDHVWLRGSASGGSGDDMIWRIAQIEFGTLGTEVPESEETYERPQAIEFYAGRAFYTGVEARGFNNNIYFSQIIEKDDQFGLCYQKNDPTSEDIGDLLADDGGLIRIPEMGQAIKMAKIYGTLVVFATNGVWSIAGSLEGGFKATEYQINKVSNVGVRTPYSFVDVRGIPVWWSEDGIYTLQYNQQSQNVEVVSLTDRTIRTFILAIPATNREYVKGAYDAANNRICWLFNDTANLPSTDYFKYNRMLCYNTLTQAFYPSTIDVSGLPDLRGIVTISYSESDGNQIKFVVTYPDQSDSAIEYLTFGNSRGTTWTDWEDFAADVSDLTQAKDYSSYFITGYKIRGQLQKYSQTNYVWVYMESETDSSCYVQSLFEFTNSAASSRWSTAQQAYKTMTNRDVHFRRLKLRGKGLAVQLKFYSETGKPFSILGFSVWETMNAAP